MKKILKLGQYGHLSNGNIKEAIVSMVNENFDDLIIYAHGTKHGLTKQEIDNIKYEVFTYRGMPSEKEHQSGYENSEANALEDAGYVYNDSKGIWVCDINKDTVSTIKKDTATLLWSYRLIKKVVTNGWNSTKQYKGTFSYPTLDSCLAHIKRKLIDEKLIEEKLDTKKKSNRV